MSKHMYAMAFDDRMRAARERGIEYRKIATLYENTPEFDAMWEAYVENDDVMYNIATEPDGRTHTFYYIYLTPQNDATEAPVEEEVHAEAAV